MMFTALLAGAPVRVVTHNSVIVTPRWMSESLVGEVERYLRQVAARRQRVVRPEELDTAAEVPLPPVSSVDVRQIYPLPPEWMTIGLCSEVPNADDIFFGLDDPGRPTLSPTAMRLAREYCVRCPVMEKCLREALSNNEQFGIWGGTTGRERARMRAQVRRGTATFEQLIVKALR